MPTIAGIHDISITVPNIEKSVLLVQRGTGAIERPATPAGLEVGSSADRTQR